VGWIIVLAALSPSTLAATYSGGSGIAGDPYLISTPADLVTLSTPANSGDWNKQFRMTNNIDMSGVSGFTPIAPDTSTTSGFQGTAFTGVFDGGGYRIQNLTINLPSQHYVGLFGYTNSASCEIRNLLLVGGATTGNSYVGGLVGQAYIGSKILRCGVAVDVAGRAFVGGLAGLTYNGVIVSGSYAAGSVSCIAQGAGGLVGICHGSVTTSYATGSVSGPETVGGLLGELLGTATASYSTGTVNGGRRTGGLVGANGTTVSSFWDTESCGYPDPGHGIELSTAEMQSISTFQAAGWSAYTDWVMNDGQYPRLAWEGTGAPAIPVPDPVPLAGAGTALDPFLVADEADFIYLSSNVSILNQHIRLADDLDFGGADLQPIGDIGPFVGVFDGNGHTIRNLVVNQPGAYKAGIFSRVGSGGQIADLQAEGIFVSGASEAGGLVGECAFGNITGCSVAGIAKATGGVLGGLVGTNTGTITGCNSTCELTGEGIVGGLIGSNSGTVTNSFSTGRVSGVDYVGGLLGSGGGTITHCYATGDVRGSNYVGGFAGIGGPITNCYSTGSVSGTDRIGGLVGSGGGTITKSYATGAVAGVTNVGGLVGSTSYTITASFWDTTTGGPDNGRGTGLTTEQMKQRSTFESAGWAFSGASPVWFIFEGQSYPYLLGLPVPIGSIDALQAVASVSVGNFYLTRDIDARATATWTAKSTDPGFLPIGTLAQPFNGTLDGRGHRIYGLHIYRPALDGVGLMGCLGPSGALRGIGLDNATITGQDQTGGLVGRNQGTITQCYVQGDVTGAASTGGLAGENSGSIDECYAAAALTGTSPGGLVEVNSGTVGASFWDTTVAGTAVSAGGTGLASSAMRLAATYTGAAWDFTGTWSIIEGRSYPYFQNSLLLQVALTPPRLINADTLEIQVETFVPGLFVTVGGGAYPAYRQVPFAGPESVSVSLKQEAINRLRISALSETGVETVTADYEIYESDQFPATPTAVSSIALLPAAVSLGQGAAQQFTCTAYFVGGGSGDITPTANWNASTGGSITPSGLYTHTSGTGAVQGLLNTGDGWISSNLATVTPAKGLLPKAGNGLVTGVVRSHYTGLGLPAGRVTGYNIFAPTVAAQHFVIDNLGNYAFYMPEGKYHFEGACSGHRSVIAWGGQLLESRRLIDPGPPEQYSDYYYSGQVQATRAINQEFALRPNDTGAPWVVFVEPVANTTVSTPNLVVTAIDADQYSELQVATYTHNTQEYSIPDRISTTGFYRETWPLQLGLNVLHLYTMDTETNASEKTIQITYDPLYTGPGGDGDGDGMPNAWESDHGLNPNSAEGIDGADGDFDGDGLSNLDEYLRGTLPNSNRSDADDLTDDFEVALGTDPLLADTDGDGIDDDVEWLQGSDPRHDDRVKMIISNLVDGQSVRGDAVTLLADAAAGYQLGAVASVSIELRGAATGGVWVPVEVVSTAPFAGTWDTSSYPSGAYELRAVSTSDAGAVDASPDVLAVNIAPAATYFERVLAGIHTLSSPVSAGQPTVLALRDGSRFARITIPAGAIAADDTLTAAFPDSAGYTPALSALQQDADLYISIALASHTGNFLNGRRSTIELGYMDADSDDHLDGSELRVPLLDIGYLPAPAAAFVPLPVNRLERTKSCVVGETEHFSLFGVVEQQPAPPLNLLTESLPQGAVGAPYSVALETFGGATPLSWAITGGALPTGLSIVGNTLQGTPTVAGTFNFTLEVSDAESQTDSRDYTIVIFAANQPTVAVNRNPGQVALAKTLSASWQIQFSEAVTGFGLDDIVLGGTAASGAVYGLSGSGTTYTFSVYTLIQDGTLHPSVKAGGAASTATFAVNRASENEQEVWVDRTKPSAAFTCGNAGPEGFALTGPILIRALPIAFNLTFDEKVYGLTQADITFAGSPPGLAYDVFGFERDYTVLVTALSGSATLTPSVVVDAATDLAGNGNYAGAYTGPSIQYAALPTVTINQAAEQADPAKTFPIVFDILFDQPVTGFATGLASPDVVYTGTAPSPQYQVTGSGAAYTLSVLSTGGDGILAFVILEDVVTEGNAASTSTDNSVRYDGTIPTVTVNQAAGQDDPARLSPVNFQIQFSETISGFTKTDVGFAGTATIGDWTLAGNGITYTLSVHPITADGTVIPFITAEVCQDLAGNLNSASTSTDNSVTFDSTPPTVTVNQAGAQADPTNTLPIQFEVTFSETVSDFDSGDVSFGGTTVVSGRSVTGSGTSYSVGATAVSGSGTIIATVPSGMAHDAAGNGNASSTSTDNSVAYDIIPPAFSNITANPDPAGESALVTLMFTASESPAANPVVSVNGHAAAFSSVAGLDYTYTYTVLAADPNGPAAVSIGATDLAGNAGTSFGSFTVDKTRPTANFTATPRAGVPPLLVQFSDSSAAVPGTPISGWNWNFGDGSPAGTGQNPAHSFGAAGVYDITLTVTDAALNSDSETKIGYVVVGGPTAAFTATPSTGYAPLAVQFNDASDPGASAITDWLWDFGDGNTSTAANPAHLYSDAGQYTVSLTVTNIVASDTETKFQYIVVTPGVPPVAGFTASPWFGTAPLSVQFTDTSALGTSPIEAWDWDFGDGETSSDQDPLHVYDLPGEYTVTLTVTSAVDSDMYSRPAYIIVSAGLPVSGLVAVILLSIVLAACAVRYLGRAQRT
jgi:PKD repeat protein